MRFDATNLHMPIIVVASVYPPVNPCPVVENAAHAPAAV
jgi:hypothetical protein